MVFRRLKGCAAMLLSTFCGCQALQGKSVRRPRGSMGAVVIWYKVDSATAKCGYRSVAQWQRICNSGN